MSVIEQFITKAQDAGQKIVLPEGQDPRVVTAANQLMENRIASVTVLGSEEEISKSCAEANISDVKFDTINFTDCEHLTPFAEEFCVIRAKKGMTMDKALEYMKNRIFFGAMMTRQGLADGMVAGSIASTAEMLRASFTVIGTSPGIQTGSSCFIMDLANPAPAGDQVLFYADCGVNPDPNAEQLADIAIATGLTYKALIGDMPKIAFLSFSTHGSANHPMLEKVKKAMDITKGKISEMGLEALVDGELQADSAIVPKVAAKKCADSPLAGAANILVFPDLNAGNICYKLTQRLAGAGAYGPILQGLAKPVNDLSRGCSAEDIYGVAAITACQAMG